MAVSVSLRRARRLTLTALRQNRGWSQRRLAEGSGFSPRAIESWEEGTRKIPERTLLRLAEGMGYQPVQVETLVLALEGLGEPQPESRTLSSFEREADARREAQLRALREGLAHAREREAGHLVQLQAQQIARERKAAEALVASLLPLGPEEREAAVEVKLAGGPSRWAFLERACAQGLREAARDPARGLAWAYFTLRRATDPEPAVEARLCGYGWAFAGHAHRLGGDLRRSESAFGWSRDFWQEGEAAASLPLEAWRMLELEAGLYRDLLEPEVALHLHDLALGEASGAAQTALLLSKAETLEGLGQPEKALASLTEAWSLIEPQPESKMRSLLGWKRADLLTRLGRGREAVPFLEEMRKAALDHGRQEDLARCLWMEARIEAARGDRARALASLRQARSQLLDLNRRQEPLEIGLEMAELHLLSREPGEARRLADEIGRGGRSTRLAQDVRSALERWRDAARTGSEMLPWVRKALAELRRNRPRTRP